VTRRRRLLIAVLVYVGLDLSLPAMPGAFVFEAAHSVESAIGGRQVLRAVVVPAPVASRVLACPVPSSEAGSRITTLREEPAPKRPVSRRLPRCVADPGRPSEDPH
jgi:hypothetical protein